MTKFYLTYTTEQPKHPKETYGVSWNSGLAWYGQIYPSDISLNDWRKEQIEIYERLMKEYQANGKVPKINCIIHPTKDMESTIEESVDFIKWC